MQGNPKNVQSINSLSVVQRQNVMQSLNTRHPAITVTVTYKLSLVVCS